MNHINNKYINDGNENSLGISFPIILRNISDEYCIGIEVVAKKNRKYLPIFIGLLKGKRQKKKNKYSLQFLVSPTITLSWTCNIIIIIIAP